MHRRGWFQALLGAALAPLLPTKTVIPIRRASITWGDDGADWSRWTDAYIAIDKVDFTAKIRAAAKSMTFCSPVKQGAFEKPIDIDEMTGPIDSAAKVE